jgi:hypothetical protein
VLKRGLADYFSNANRTEEKDMNNQEVIQELEASVVILGAVYGLSLVGMIGYLTI